MTKVLANVFIKNIHLEASVGIFSHEKTMLQPLLITAELFFDPVLISPPFSQPPVDYAQAADSLIRLVNLKHYDLLEEMAYSGMRMLFAQFSVVQAIRLELSKPKAVPSAQQAGLSFYQNRIDWGVDL